MGEQVPAIEVVKVSRIYGEGGEEAKTVALQNVSFSIDHGEFVAIIGPSGSGKSTLLNLIGGLDRPTSGTVKIDGVDISKIPNSELARIRNRKIGFVFQSFNLINRITAVENVELPLLVTGMPRVDIRGRALEQLEILGIRHKADRKPTQLSGGEQQRVAVARALATNPLIILGDEPTGNLDTKNTDVMVGILKRLNQELGKTIVIITHNTEIAAKTKKIISIRDGLIQEIREN
ncbi:MAG: ABC transporter ATP-binding protein [Nitrososphaerales archaeon]|nr:ABC transporter ATP-binding protein [Nitrososphaerales archaeon]